MERLSKSEFLADEAEAAEIDDETQLTAELIDEVQEGLITLRQGAQDLLDVIEVRSLRRAAFRNRTIADGVVGSLRATIEFTKAVEALADAARATVKEGAD